MDPYEGLLNEGYETAPWWLDFGMSPGMALAAFGGLGLLHAKLSSKKAMAAMYKSSRGAAVLQSAGTWAHQGWDRSSLRNLWSNRSKYADGRRYGAHEWRQRTARYLEGKWGGRVDLSRVRQYENLHDDLRRVARGSRGKNLFSRLWGHMRASGGYKEAAARYGSGVAGRVALAGITGNVMTFLGVTGLAYMGATLLGGVAESIANWQPTAAVNPEVEFGGGQLVQPRAAMTQRQRALMAIHNSQLSVHAALGNEAAHVHA